MTLVQKKWIAHGKTFLITYPQCNAQIAYIGTNIHQILGDNLSYLCVSDELHKTGDPHRHAFIRLNKSINVYSTTFDIPIPDTDLTWHGNYQSCRRPKEALKYVQKDGKFIEYGTYPFSIVKTTKEEKNDILLHENLEDLVESGDISLYKYVQIKKARDLFKISRNQGKIRDKPQVFWLYGPTGSGKTRYAISNAKGDYWISSEPKWFDGYSGQETAILDDLRAGSYEFNWLLRLLDRYNVLVPIKGGFVNWEPKRIFITAPAEPRKVFINHETGEPWDRIEQLERRIDRVIDMEVHEIKDEDVTEPPSIISID